MRSRGFRLFISLSCVMMLGGGLTGCVSKARYNRVLEANQACEKRLDEQQAKLDQINSALLQARADLGDASDRQMTDEAIISELRRVMAERQGRLTEYENQLTVRILAKYLFPSGQANLTQSGRDVLGKVAAWLQESDARHIFVEGHTDTVPIGRSLQGKFKTNWELSAARATTVVRFLVDQGVSRDKLIAVGYGENQPVASNDSEDNREQNRRIEITLQDADFREVVGQVPQNVPRTALININEASASELIVLPGVSPEMARSIVEYRARAGRFDTFDDLRQVRGVDPQVLQPIETMITFGGDTMDETGTTPDMLQNRDMQNQGTDSTTPNQDMNRSMQNQGTDQNLQNQGTDQNLQNQGTDQNLQNQGTQGTDNTVTPE